MAFNLRFAPTISFAGLNNPLFLYSAGSDDPVTQIAFAADQGFAGIQDPLAAERDTSEQVRIGQAIAQRGLANGCFLYAPRGGIVPGWGSAERADIERLTVQIQNAIEVGKRIGSRQIAIISPVTPRAPRDQQRLSLIENLSRVVPLAERAGMVLCIESVNARRLPNMMIHNILDALAVVEAVGSPAVRLIFDFAHIQAMDGDILFHLDKTWPHVEVVQIADNPSRLEPGSGELNFEFLLNAVAQRGYGGLYELEHFWAAPGIEAETVGLRTLLALDAAVARPHADKATAQAEHRS